MSTMQTHHGFGSSTTNMSFPFPMACTVEFTDDLPNGPYAQIEGIQTKAFVVQGSSWAEVAEVCRAHMQKTADGQAMHGGTAQYTMNQRTSYTIESVSYKGGLVDGYDEARDGPCTVNLKMATEMNTNTNLNI